MPRPGLSPSRAADFARCPLLYRFRAVDRLPEPRTAAQARGTVVHRVLDRLFDLPPAERTPAGAVALVPSALEWAIAEDPSITAAIDQDGPRELFVEQVNMLVRADFALEDPSRLAPEARELWVEAPLGGGRDGGAGKGGLSGAGTGGDGEVGIAGAGVREGGSGREHSGGDGIGGVTGAGITTPQVVVRGYIDRLDAQPGTGALRVVDYKTGKIPKPAYRHEALFQLRCYALALWRLRGTVPAMLQLLYLASAEAIRSEPTTAELEKTEARLLGLWGAIVRCARTGEWPAARGPLCPWCSFQDQCPAFGQAAPLPPPDTLARLGLGEPAA
jgi:putative RecB family exonuclease